MSIAGVVANHITKAANQADKNDDDPRTDERQPEIEISSAARGPKSHSRILWPMLMQNPRLGPFLAHRARAILKPLGHGSALPQERRAGSSRRPNCGFDNLGVLS